MAVQDRQNLLWHPVMPPLKRPLTKPGLAKRQLSLIEGIYLTASDPEGWRPLLRDLVAATASRSARLLVMNADADRVTSSLKINIDDHYHRQYTEYFVNKCPWRPELRRMAPGLLHSTFLHFSCRQPQYYRTEFYNDWARGQDIHHGLCGTVYRDGDRTVQLLIQRTRDQGHYTEADTAFVNRLVPHIEHSFVIAEKLAAARSHAEAIAAAAERETRPYVLLNESLKVIYCSPAAAGLLEGDGPLALKKERLVVSDELQDRRLQQLIRRCLAAADTRRFETGGESMAISRPARPDLQLTIRPLLPEIPLLAGETGVYVAVYLCEPQSRIEIDAARLSDLYGLSAAEARVACSMVAAPDTEELARKCAISLNTLRTHLKAVFAKTQTRSRAELMKLLLTGPARLR